MVVMTNMARHEVGPKQELARYTSTVQHYGTLSSDADVEDTGTSSLIRVTDTQIKLDLQR